MGGMVGICGIVFREAPVEGSLQRILSKLEGRGGSGLDEWNGDHASLGSTGGDIWHSPDGTIHILFDGRITNFEEVIQQIPETPSTPQEAICALYQKENDRKNVDVASLEVTRHSCDVGKHSANSPCYNRQA